MSNVHFVATKLPASEIPRFYRITDVPINQSSHYIKESKNVNLSTGNKSQIIKSVKYSKPIIETSIQDNKLSTKNDHVCMIENMVDESLSIKSSIHSQEPTKDTCTKSSSCYCCCYCVPRTVEDTDVESIRTSTKCAIFVKYIKAFIAFLFSHIGSCLVVVGYCIAGAFLFQFIEQYNHIELMNNISRQICGQYQEINDYIDSINQDYVNSCISNANLWWNDNVIWQTQIKNVLVKYGLSTDPNILDTELKLLESHVLTSEKVYEMSNFTDKFDLLKTFSQDLERNIHSFPSINTKAKLGTLISKIISTVHNSCNTGWPSGYIQDQAVDFDIMDLGCDNNQTSFRRPWSITEALLYSMTVITTIGYGHIVTRTEIGRLVTVIYAICGIPMVLLCLTNLGGVMADTVRLIYFHSCLKLSEKRRLKRQATKEHPKVQLKELNTSNVDERRSQEDHKSTTKRGILNETYQGTMKNNNKYNWQVNFNPCNANSTEGCLQKRRSSILHTFANSQSIIKSKTKDNRTSNDIRVPIGLTSFVFIIYMFIGAFIFVRWEGWSVIQSTYFVFITLSTIGFGDMVPKIDDEQWHSSSAKPIFCCFYLLIGLAMVAMCFNLMQEEVRSKFRRFAHKTGLIE